MNPLANAAETQRLQMEENSYLTFWIFGYLDIWILYILYLLFIINTTHYFLNIKRRHLPSNLYLMKKVSLNIP